MSKAKEYYDVGNTWLMKLDIGALKKMNHKTLEDVKELIASNRHNDDHDAIKIFAKEILTELEKLKL